jgi:SAM-dependent methyltransferase
MFLQHQSSLTMHLNQDPYKVIAPVFDTVTRAFLSKPRARIIKLCQEYETKRVLDMGCGTGALLSQMLNSGVLAVGADLSTAMLARALAKRDAWGNALPLLQMNGLHPSFKTGSFDALIYCLMLHETGPAMDEILRHGFALAPLAFVLEWRSPERNLDYPVTAWISVVERLAGKAHYQSYRRFISQGGIYGLAHRAGAKIEQAETLRAGSLVLAVLSG